MLGTVEVTLPPATTPPPKGDSIFQGTILSGGVIASIDQGYAITVEDQIPVCCVPPKPSWAENCILEYAVYCDKRNPAWGIAASSDEPDVRFSFEPEHPNGLHGYACTSPAQVNATASTVANLGLADVVEVIVMRGDLPVARFPVHLANVERGAYPLTSDDLKKANEEAAKQSYQSYTGPTRDYQKDQPTLPSKVTVVKR
jgi:hypothetical protein